MKSFAPLALLAIGVAAVPFQKRDYATTTVIDVIVETVDVYTTVFVQPGDPRLNQNQQAMAQNLPASTSAQSSSSAIYIPEQKKAAAYVPPAPTSTPPPSSSPSPSPSVTSSSAPAVVAAPEKMALAPVQQAPAPVQQPAAPAVNPPTSGGGACGTVNGKCSGDVTTFDGGVGACGFDDATFTPNYFALAYEMMGELSNTNKNCNRTAEISYGGKTFTATLQDKCMGCKGASIDLSKSLFQSIFGADTGRFHDVEWKFTSPMAN